MNKKEFKIEYVLDYKKYKEFSNAFNVTNIKMQIILIAFLLLMIINLYQENYKEAVTGIIIVLLLGPLGKKIQFKKQLNFNNNEELDRSIIINDKITATSKRGNKTVIDFDQIVGITESENLIILKLKYNKGITIDKNNITGGTKEELIEYLLNKCNIKIKNAKTWSLIRTIIIVVTTIIGIIAILTK